MCTSDEEKIQYTNKKERKGKKKKKKKTKSPRNEIYSSNGSKPV